jgi:hypothetical protein
MLTEEQRFDLWNRAAIWQEQNQADLCDYFDHLEQTIAALTVWYEKRCKWLNDKNEQLQDDNEQLRDELEQLKKATQKSPGGGAFRAG